MIQDLQRNAESVAAWPMHGLRLPKGLSTAISVYEAVKAVPTELHQFDFSSLTAQNAQKKIEEFAERVAVYANSTPGRGSVILETRNSILLQAARKVVAEARAAVPELAKQFEEVVAEAATRYVAAVEGLPSEVSPDSILSAGPDAAEAFDQAKDAASELSAVEAWLTTARQILVGGDPETVLRLNKPTNAVELAKLDNAYRSAVNSSNTALRALNAVWLLAAREGIPFEIVLPTEADALRRDLSIRVTVVK